ncbi:MAG: SxtJ family membrane protein [Pyrinomonadaceae bacterium]
MTKHMAHHPHHMAEVTDAQARKTALVVAGVLATIAAWSLYRQRLTLALVTAGIGATLLVAGLLLPPLARRFHVLWMMLAVALGWINSRVLLTLLFYLAFMPYGVVSRLVGRDPLNRRGAARDSYWIPRKKTRQASEGFERLF